MATVDLPIAGGHYLSDSLPISAQECTNWYPNLPQTKALSQETLFGTPGILAAPGASGAVTTGNLPTDANRGSIRFNDSPFFVNGNSLYRLNESFIGGNAEYDAQFLGAIEGSGRVSMAENGSQIMILVPLGKGYIFTENPDLLAEITDPDFTANGAPLQSVFVDGYFAVTTNDSKWIISAVNDGTAWNALDFGTAESSPDPVVVPLIHKNQAFIGGRNTWEGFQNVGGSGFPFKRSGLFLDKGVYAPFSAISGHNTFAFIGGGVDESPSIWTLNGNSLSKLSTTAIDSILERFTLAEVDQSFSYSYAQKGAQFICFSLPTTTVVIDQVTGRWHERRSRITEPDGTIVDVRSRVNSVVRAYGKLFVGDSEDGRIGILDVDTYTEYGLPILRRVATQPFSNNFEPVFVPKLELTVESGVGNSDVPNPVIRMDISKDGGKTFADSRTRPLGKVGEYDRRAIWRRNGRIDRMMVLRFSLTDSIKPVVISLTADLRPRQ